MIETNLFIHNTENIHTKQMQFMYTLAYVHQVPYMEGVQLIYIGVL